MWAKLAASPGTNATLLGGLWCLPRASRWRRYMKKPGKGIRKPKLKTMNVQMLVYDCYEKKVVADEIDDREGVRCLNHAPDVGLSMTSRPAPACLLVSPPEPTRGLAWLRQGLFAEQVRSALHLRRLPVRRGGLHHEARQDAATAAVLWSAAGRL